MLGDLHERVAVSGQGARPELVAHQHDDVGSGRHSHQRRNSGSSRSRISFTAFR